MRTRVTCTSGTWYVLETVDEIHEFINTYPAPRFIELAPDNPLSKGTVLLSVPSIVALEPV